MRSSSIELVPCGYGRVSRVSIWQTACPRLIFLAEEEKYDRVDQMDFIGGAASMLIESVDEIKFSGESPPNNLDELLLRGRVYNKWLDTQLGVENSVSLLAEVIHDRLRRGRAEIEITAASTSDSIPQLVEKLSRHWTAKKTRQWNILCALVWSSGVIPDFVSWDEIDPNGYDDLLEMWVAAQQIAPRLFETREKPEL